MTHEEGGTTVYGGEGEISPESETIYQSDDCFDVHQRPLHRRRIINSEVKIKYKRIGTGRGPFLLGSVCVTRTLPGSVSFILDIKGPQRSLPELICPKKHILVNLRVF